MKKTIKYVVMGGILAAGAFAFESCSKKDTPLPAIDGYNSSDDVANTSLLAYWSFDNTLNESKSGTAPKTTVGNTFTTGQKGQALALSNGYLVYPTISNLSSASAFGSVTVSLWVNIKSTGGGTSQTNVFGITKSQDSTAHWNDGPLNVYVETSAHIAGSDTLQVHSDFHSWPAGVVGGYGNDNVNNYGGTLGTDYQLVTSGGTWMHYVAIYDGNASTVNLYVNNVLVSDDLFALRTHGANVPNGPLVIIPPTQVIVGGWPNAATGFSHYVTESFEGLMTGSVDEIRVYGKALTTAEIGGLYALGQAGR